MCSKNLTQQKVPDPSRKAVRHITLEVGAEQALREGEERFRQFGEASTDVLWIRSADTLKWEYLSAAFESIYGCTRDSVLKGNDPTTWLNLVLPQDRERALAELRRVRSGERATFEYRISRPIDGEVRWLRNNDFPIFDDSGRVCRLGGVGRDITDEKSAADRLDVLVCELQHRTRNLFAVVLSIARGTMDDDS